MLWPKTTRCERWVNQNSEIMGHKSKTMSLKTLKHIEELRGAAELLIILGFSVYLYRRLQVQIKMLFIAALNWIITGTEVRKEKDSWLPKANTLPAFKGILNIHPGRTCTPYAQIFFHSYFPLLFLFLFFPPLCLSLKVTVMVVFELIWHHQDCEAKRSRVELRCRIKSCSSPQEKIVIIHVTIRHTVSLCDPPPYKNVSFIS